MATDYILFLHGVNVREFPDAPDDPNFPKYANALFELIQNSLKSGGATLEKIAIYYGDLNMHEEQTLVDLYQRSPEWKNFWFRHVRETFLLQIIGDIALYISPNVSAKIVARLHKAIARLQREGRDQQKGGRLHLVSHSLGTIILFDVLFASRWENKAVPGYDYVMEIREALYGLGAHNKESIHIASIHTMGSPIALFSLINMHGRQQEAGTYSTEHAHDIGPRLQQFLQHLSKDRRGKPLPWWNFAHPGDPLASPLAQLVPLLVDQMGHYLEVHDMLISPHDLQDRVVTSFSQSAAALIHSNAAHHSYWTSKTVASRIAQTIQEATALYQP